MAHTESQVLQYLAKTRPGLKPTSGLRAVKIR